MGNIGNLVKNPLGIIGIFLGLIYGIAGLVTANLDKQSGNVTILIWFLVLFPVLLLGMFAYLVIYHHSKLYAPTDFVDEENCMMALEAGLKKSQIVSNLEEFKKYINSPAFKDPVVDIILGIVKTEAIKESLDKMEETK